MALRSGIDEFINSMAADMQEAFFQAWPDYMDNNNPPPSNPQLKLMFVAIARGVVKHLTDHPEAFRVNLNSSSNAGTHKHTGNVNIDGS